MKNSNIVFMGTPEFASNILNGLISNGYNISLVVTQPDKEVGRKRILTPSPVKIVAEENKIPVFQPRRIKEDYQTVLDYKPDLIVTCAYGQIIPEELLNYPKYKCINTHGSLLPKYRGGSPIQRAIINGEDSTGITIMYMSKGMDEGDILYQEALPIDITDTNTTLFKKLSDLALKMLLDFLPKVFSNDVSPMPQDSSKATYAYNLKKEDEYISFNDSTINVYNHIRGLLDNPGAYSIIENKKYKFHKVSFSNEYKGKIGEVLGIKENKLAIATIDGAILVEMIQPEGKNIMSAKNFYNGQGKNLLNKCFEVIDGSK